MAARRKGIKPEIRYVTHHQMWAMKRERKCSEAQP